MIEKILELSKIYKQPLIMCFTEHIDKFKDYKKIDIGSIKNLDEISKNLFKALRRINIEKPEIVFVEGVKKEGVGLAIMNRLIRACDHNYIEI
ncbi:SUA5 domain protein [compost metagenome]